MTDRHPMDDVTMPDPNFIQVGIEQGTNRRVQIKNFTADQLRAECIAAYELGRNAGLEEAAKKVDHIFRALSEGGGTYGDAVRSLKR